MNEQKILAVKNSWSYIIIRPEEAGVLFYGKLFELDPSLKPLFKGDIRDQAKKLMSMVTVVITKLHKLDDIMQEINSLAARHVHYGARPEHYQVVGQALLWTLKEGLGHRWDELTQEAWTEVYALLSGAMIQAMAAKK